MAKAAARCGEVSRRFTSKPIAPTPQGVADRTLALEPEGSSRRSTWRLLALACS